MQPTSLWQPGALFHVASRYPRRAEAKRVDRLAGILRSGLIAPAHAPEVCSDLHLEVRGTEIPYDSLIHGNGASPGSAEPAAHPATSHTTPPAGNQAAIRGSAQRPRSAPRTPVWAKPASAASSTTTSTLHNRCAGFGHP